VQVPDLAADGAASTPGRAATFRAGFRALLVVPLLRDDRAVGGLVLSRRTPGAFSPEVIELVQRFATHSALTIDAAGPSDGATVASILPP
jgi:GAF domain-containing protein